MASLPEKIRKKTSECFRAIRQFNHQDLLKGAFVIAVVICGALARIKLFPNDSGDLSRFVIPWYEYLRDNGGFRAVGNEFGDYTPMYYYFLAFLTYTEIPVKVGVKVFSGIFELICAVYIKRILDIEYRGTSRPLLGFAIASMLPTAITNSGAWGQCDGIYTCFVVMSLYYFLKGRDLVSMGVFGVALSLKLQAIFFIPFIGVMVMRRKLRLRSLLMIPAVYIVSILPAVFAGGNFFRLLTVYTRQSGQYHSLNMALPNVWSLLDGVDPGLLGSSGIFFAGGATLIIMYYCVFGAPDNYKLTVRGAVVIAVLSCFTVPYFLPHMHERYYFCSDMLVLAAALCFPQRIWLIASTQICSFIAVAGNIFGKERFDMRIVAMIETVSLVAVLLSLRDEYNSTEGRELVMRFEKRKSLKKGVKHKNPVNKSRTAKHR